MPTADEEFELEFRKFAAEQTHCLTCGRQFTSAKYECPVCGEWSCSEECRQKHIETMDRI